MKILEKGRAQTGWSKEFRCTGDGNGGGGCGALLLVEQDDVYQTSRCSMGDCDYFRTFTCGACGVETDIDASIPFSIPTKTKWKARQANRDVEPY